MAALLTSSHDDSASLLIQEPIACAPDWVEHSLGGLETRRLPEDGQEQSQYPAQPHHCAQDLLHRLVALNQATLPEEK